MSDIRLNNAVIRGEVDNTRAGIVLLTLWLTHEPLPITLKLMGSPLRDIAGSHIRFAHTMDGGAEPTPIDLSQIKDAHLGEITASARVYHHSQNALGEYIQPERANTLRIEFFCEYGRVILESTQFTLTFESRTWKMSVEDEFAQMASNFASLQAYLQHNISYDISTDAQHLANMYDEVRQRLADPLHFDQNEAALLGWSGVLKALAEEGVSDASFASQQDEFSDLDSMGEDECLEEEEWNQDSYDSEERAHPIIGSVQELIEELEIQSSTFKIPKGRSFQALLGILHDVQNGLTGLLSPSVINSMPLEICILGCKEHLGKTVAALYHFSKLLDITESEEGRRELLLIREHLLDIRENISALRFQIHKL